MTATPAIELATGAEDNGLADMIANLIRDNLADQVGKRKDFERMNGRVAIVARDIGVSLTLHFESGRLTVHDGIVGIPDVTVRADSDDVINMSLIELTRLGLPDLRGEKMRAVMASSREGRIELFGALGHLPLMLRLTRIMSVN